MKKLLSIVLLIGTLAYANAQVDTLLIKKLNLIEVYISYNGNINPGAAQFTFDSVSLAQNQNASLADLLSTEGGAFIKSYGLGSLASTSVRGAGASHTKVLWNGFDVSNPMLGQVDLSYFNVNTFDDIAIQFGNTSGAYGSGTQGGVIKLTNLPQFDRTDKLKLNLNGGSFGYFSKNLCYSTSSKGVATSISLNQSDANNDFKFIENGITRRRENAYVNSIGINMNNAIKINLYETLVTNIWFQNNERGIPSGIGITNKDEKLTNEFLRSSIGWDRVGVKHDYNLSGAYFEEQLNYFNPASGIVDNTRFKKLIADATFKKRISNSGELVFGSNLTRTQAFSDNYIDVPERISNAYYVAYNKPFFNNDLLISPSIRKEFVNEFGVPITGSLGISYSLIEQVSLLGSVSKNYRLPTFNDLYFGILGNSELKPEEGWSSEFSTQYQIKTTSIRGTVFYNDYTNWIAWQPSSNGVWQPQNKNIISRGVELNANTKWRRCFVRFNASYTESIDLETDKQLIYVPYISTNTTVGYFYKSLTLYYSQQFVDERFITTDNSRSLPFYTLGNINLNRNIEIKNSIISMGVEIKNIFNYNYQAVVNQPMPGRYYGINLSIEYNNKNNIL